MVPVTGTWLPTMQAAGIPTSPDADNGNNLGAFFATSAINPTNWTRSYSRSAYLDPASARTNLHVLVNATVTRVTWANDIVAGDLVASGVEYSTGLGAAVNTVMANREVILSGGAVGSPQILMLSGIGPRDVLEAAGVSVKSELPGVGQHLQDHLVRLHIFSRLLPLTSTIGCGGDVGDAERYPRIDLLLWLRLLCKFFSIGRSTL